MQLFSHVRKKYKINTISRYKFITMPIANTTTENFQRSLNFNIFKHLNTLKIQTNNSNEAKFNCSFVLAFDMPQNMQRRHSDLALKPDYFKNTFRCDWSFSLISLLIQSVSSSNFQDIIYLSRCLFYQKIAFHCTDPLTLVNCAPQRRIII